MDSEGAGMPAFEQAGENHKWLAQLIGEWTFEGEADSPDSGKVKSSGHETVRGLGELWVIGDGSGEMPGCGLMNSILTLGFNSQTGRFVGTWVGSIMSNLWVYDGELDSARKVLTLNCQGPSMEEPGKLTSYRDIIDMASPNERKLRSEMQTASGEWVQFMEMVYTRVS